MKLLIFLLILVPAQAHAYLDPGTGNALVAAFFGLLGAGIYFIKNTYYSIKSKITGEKYTQEDTLLAFFSEGKRYWPYFEDIFHELAKRGVKFSFYTLDLYDPALDTEYDNAKVYYAGRGNKGYAKINNLREAIVVSTTPNIGTEGFPVVKSKHIKKLIHLYHGIYDTDTYIKGSLDHYDTVFMNGHVQEKSIRELEQKRGLVQKDLYITGSPFIDRMIRKSKDLKCETDGKTILVASTWDKKGCLSSYGSGFIIQLAKAGFNVIIRPHPQSYITETAMIEKLKKDTKSFANVSFDKEPDGLKSMAKADLMISDISGVRFDFLFCYNRPVITLETDMQDLSAYEYADLGYLWEHDISPSIGILVNKKEITGIASIAEIAIRNGSTATKEEIQNICITGNSAKTMADTLEKIASDVFNSDVLNNEKIDRA